MYFGNQLVISSQVCCDVWVERFRLQIVVECLQHSIYFSKSLLYVNTKFLSHYIRKELCWNSLVKILLCSVVKGPSFIVKWLLIL